MPQTLAEQFKSIPMSSNLGESLERARGFARSQTHRCVLLEHLLLALIEDADAAAVLRASNIDAVQLGTDVSDYLGRLMEDMRAEPGTEPHADAELLRVLQAAGQAAQQSRRRRIDGAIVLAAIVGDGKSPAAGLLKTLGLGFEEAIRALQKANAQARSRQFAPASPAATAQLPEGGTASKPATAPGDSVPSSEPAPQCVEAPQTVEEILAAARARIQRRTAAMIGRAEPAFSRPAEAPPPPEQPVQTDLRSASEPPVSTPTQPAPDATGTGAQAIPDPPPLRPDATPAPPSRARPTSTASIGSQPAGRLPPSTRNPPPPPPSPLQPPRAGDWPARPPLPHGSGPALPPQPGLPSRPPGAPWPDPPDVPSLPRPPGNGAAAAGPAGVVPPPRPGQRPAPGPLVETIPRRMQVGAPSSAQVRISRDKIDGLLLLLLGHRGVPHRQDAFLMRALSVRLIAPDGGFWIESASPETHWVETAPSRQQDDHASWRWTVVPQRRGRHRLLLVVTARTVGRDGLAAETAPPDRVIEVTVKGNLGQRAVQWTRLLAAVLLGALIGRFGHEVWALAATAFKRLAGG